MKKINKIILKEKPAKNIKDGILCLFETDTDFETNLAFADIIKSQVEYDYPDVKRKIKSFYIKYGDKNCKYTK